jgi:hypothetical protein
MMADLYADDVVHRRRHAQLQHGSFEPVRSLAPLAIDRPDEERGALVFNPMAEHPLHAVRRYAFIP